MALSMMCCRRSSRLSRARPIRSDPLSQWHLTTFITKYIFTYKTLLRVYTVFVVVVNGTQGNGRSTQKRGENEMSSQQVVLVTGTSSGFGQLTAETLARQGNIVFAAMRNTRQSNAERAQQFRVLAEREQLAIHVVDLDTNDEASVDRTVASIVESTGRIDVLVNNVGIGAW